VATPREFTASFLYSKCGTPSLKCQLSAGMKCRISTNEANRREVVGFA
jgi:hypothetical protein